MNATNQPITVAGKVKAAEVYQPHLVSTMWFKTWAMRCGCCNKVFVRFALFGTPRCPYCRTLNSPEFELHY